MEGKGAAEGQVPGRSSAGPGGGLQGGGHAAVLGQRPPRLGGGFHGLRRHHLEQALWLSESQPHRPAEDTGWGKVSG